MLGQPICWLEKPFQGREPLGLSVDLNLCPYPCAICKAETQTLGMTPTLVGGFSAPGYFSVFNFRRKSLRNEYVDTG